MLGFVWAFSSVGLVHEDHAGFHTDMPSVNGNRLSTHPASNRHTSIAPIVRSNVSIHSGEEISKLGGISIQHPS